MRRHYLDLSDRPIDNSKFCRLTILQYYTPTNEDQEDNKEDWYGQLQMADCKVPQHNMLLISGRMKVKVGTDYSNYKRAMGTHGDGTRNNSGEHLVDFCLKNNLVIGGTIFPHKNDHKVTWKSPDVAINHHLIYPIYYYRISPKIIIKIFLSVFLSFEFECSVLMGNSLTEWFPVQSVVRQGCIIWDYYDA